MADLTTYHVVRDGWLYGALRKSGETVQLSPAAAELSVMNGTLSTEAPKPKGDAKAKKGSASDRNG